MPTVNQLIKYGRTKKKHKKSNRMMKGNPQRRGTVIKVAVMDPKKPNSANRPYCKVKLTDGKMVNAHIPGDRSASLIHEHSQVLIRGGGPPDMPGVNYRVIMGVLDTQGGSPGCFDPNAGMKSTRRNSRSKYGVRRPC